MERAQGSVWVQKKREKSSDVDSCPRGVREFSTLGAAVGLLKLGKGSKWSAPG